jgi:hypothetical protein
MLTDGSIGDLYLPSGYRTYLRAATHRLTIIPDTRTTGLVYSYLFSHPLLTILDSVVQAISTPRWFCPVLYSGPCMYVNPFDLICKLDLVLPFINFINYVNKCVHIPVKKSELRFLFSI